MRRQTIAVLLVSAVVTGILWARLSAPERQSVVTLPPQATVNEHVLPEVATVRKRPDPTPEVTTTQKDRKPSSSHTSKETLAQLALVAKTHTGEASACFRQAWMEGRLVDNHIALHLSVDTDARGTPWHVTAPNTDEHLWAEEACLADIFSQQSADTLPEQSGGMIWSLRLPTETWATQTTD